MQSCAAPRDRRLDHQGDSEGVHACGPSHNDAQEGSDCVHLLQPEHFADECGLGTIEKMLCSIQFEVLRQTLELLEPASHPPCAHVGPRCRRLRLCVGCERAEIRSVRGGPLRYAVSFALDSVVLVRVLLSVQMLSRPGLQYEESRQSDTPLRTTASAAVS